MGSSPILFGVAEHAFPELAEQAAAAAFESAHHVALAWVVDPERSAVLLVEHRTMRWSCPGGHIETGERLVDAAVRELHEETGLSLGPAGPSPVTLGRSVGCARFPGSDTVHWAAGFLFLTDSTEPIRAEPGARAHWFAFDALPVDRVDEIDVVVDHLAELGLR